MSNQHQEKLNDPILPDNVDENSLENHNETNMREDVDGDNFKPTSSSPDTTTNAAPTTTSTPSKTSSTPTTTISSATSSSLSSPEKAAAAVNNSALVVVGGGGISSTSVREFYHDVKRIDFHGKRVAHLTQNENGPCPLIALSNVLLLEEKISLPESQAIVSAEEMISHITNYIFNHTPTTISANHMADYQANLNDALTLFPQLLTGLDVNIRFQSITSFEYTPALIIFDLLSIRLYHGWLVDPSDTITYSAIATSCYNGLVEKIITQKSNLDDPDKVQEALIAEKFLEENASQLTYHGLVELNTTMKSGQTAVLFRNNHFSTIHKHKDHLYVLVTDLGFLGEPNVVWETLYSVDGESEFVNQHFQVFQSVHDNDTVTTTNNKSPTTNATKTTNSSYSKDNVTSAAAIGSSSSRPPQHSIDVSRQISSDYQLALSLSTAEETQASKKVKATTSDPSVAASAVTVSPSSRLYDNNKYSSSNVSGGEGGGGSSSNATTTTKINRQPNPAPPSTSSQSQTDVKNNKNSKSSCCLS